MEQSDRVAALMGARYAKVRLSNWEFATGKDGDRQRVVVKAVDDMCHDLSHIVTGANVLFYGPPGTGKDRLLASLVRAADCSGCSVQFESGANLLSKFRDLMDRQTTEGQFLNDLKKPGVLCISDPVPPGCSLTEFQVSWLYRIVDARYRQQKPVWMTLNIAGKEDAERLLTPQLWDRLRDGAIVIPCNWPSYRKPTRVI